MAKLSMITMAILAIMDDLASFNHQTVIWRLGDLGGWFAGITVDQQQIRLLGGGDSAAIAKGQTVDGVTGAITMASVGGIPMSYHVGQL